MQIYNKRPIQEIITQTSDIRAILARVRVSKKGLWMIFSFIFLAWTLATNKIKRTKYKSGLFLESLAIKKNRKATRRDEWISNYNPVAGAN